MNVHPPPCAHDDCSSTIALQPSWERFQGEARHGTLDTGRYRMPYFVWGEGPPVVFVHGLCEDAAALVLPLARLSRRFCCIAYDQPTGAKDGAKLCRYRHADLVADLFALVEHLNLAQCHLYGSSFGSTIVLPALAQAPQRFARVVLQGGFARRPLAPAERLLASLARYWPGRMSQLPLRTAVLRVGQGKGFAAREPAVWDFYLRRNGGFPIHAVARRALMIHQTDLRTLLPSIRQPTLLVCGERDNLVDRTCEQDMLTGLPHVARAEIEGAGHLPQFTHPEVLCEVIERFLR